MRDRESTSRHPRVVYTAGVFDLLHRGHLNVLWASKAVGDLLVVGCVSDTGCHAYKGHFPAQHAQLRERNIRSLECVDLVVSQPSTDPTALLERIRPDVFTHADGGENWSRLRGQVEALGIEYLDLPYTAGISSTQVRQQRKRRSA